MVYQGKPSRGCGTCRQRRVKCDERKPTCFRCEKARRTCTGYRPEFEIVHRSENQALERRMRAAAEREAPAVKARKGSNTWAQTNTGDWNSMYAAGSAPFSSSPTASGGGLSPTISVSLEDQSSCHFASNFILVPTQGYQAGHYEFLLPLMASEPVRSPLRQAFRACAYASLAGTTLAGSVNLTELAITHHTEALNQTHLALANPQYAKSDALVATVLLLCVFENMMATKETGMLAWRSHIEGAVQIIKSRGREQHQSALGHRLFTAVRHQMVARLLSSGTAPIMGVEWWSVSGSNSITNVSQVFSCKTSQLRAEVSRLITTVERDQMSIELMLEMARRVRIVDQDIASWLVSLPEEYRFKTLCWQEYPSLQTPNLREMDVFPGRVDVYPDFIVAEAWNLARVSRLILASLSIRLTAWICSPVDYHTTPEYATVKRICEGIVSDMIASIPYHLGWHTKRKELFSSPELVGFACGEDSAMKTLPAMFVVWPLACMQTLDLTTEDQREWCKGRLAHIGNHLGLKYAHILANSGIRFPSMMIRHDGMMPSPDPLQVKIGAGLKVPRSPSQSL